MRTPGEIRFRLAQEARNLRLLWRQPGIDCTQQTPLNRLPDPAMVVADLAGSSFANEATVIAEQILAHRFPLFGAVVETGPTIDWRRDYVHNKESGAEYFRRIPYLDFDRVGDHKLIWELNRHQHLIVLAQAFLFTGRQDFLRELIRQLESWHEANPFQRGINWASALEVAFRALSWIWVYHLAGSHMSAAFQRRLVQGLYRHGLHLENNLSVYFSPNTHLLGEAVVLHALGVLLPALPRSRQWAQTGARIVEEQLDRQVRSDGTHFEQSSYYHVYALDLFLLHYLLAGRPAGFREKLVLMADYLNSLLGPGRAIPVVGDDDGGRVFHPYGNRARFGCATLATCAVLFSRQEWGWRRADLDQQAIWWIGKDAMEGASSQPARGVSRLFSDSGLAVMSHSELQVLVKAGGFGANRAGHSHSDCLSVVVRCGSEQILIDPGTYTYVADAIWRDWFRGSAAHNTIRVDGQDQATARPQFGWRSKPETVIRAWKAEADKDSLDTSVRYNGIEHRRRVLFMKPHRLFIIDEIRGGGNHIVEQFWHLGLAAELSSRCLQIGSQCRLVLSSEARLDPGGGEHGWSSPVFGVRTPAPVALIRLETSLPCYLAAALDFSSGCEPLALILTVSSNEFRLRLEGGGDPLIVRIPV